MGTRKNERQKLISECSVTFWIAARRMLPEEICGRGSGLSILAKGQFPFP
jgi:hypothetical protein